MNKLRRGLSRALIAAVMVAASGALAVPAATPVGAAGSLRFTGKIVGDIAGTSLFIVATGGQAVRAIPQANGQFAVDVPTSILRSFVEDYAGASVQVVKFGFYVGPVSLGAPKVWRLKTKLPPVVDLGTVKISKTGGSATTKSSFTDRKSLRQKPNFSREIFSKRDDIWTSVGGDDDGDGTPNMFDRDADGNGISDGAQLKMDWTVAAKDIGRMNPKNTLTRSFGSINLRADFRGDERGDVPINTNVDPSATLEQLQGYQDKMMQVTMGGEIEKGQTSWFDCWSAFFCDSSGEVQILPDQGNTQGNYGHFSHPMNLGGTGRLVPEGIVGLYSRRKGDTIVDQRAGMVRAAVASPPIVATLGGVPQKYPLEPDTVSTGSASFSSLTVEFYRPQELLTKPRLFMADRGGFLYSAMVAGLNGTFNCTAKNVTPGNGLIPVNFRWDGPKFSQQYFDYTPKPKNGELLSLTIDVFGCLENSSNGAKAPASGENIDLEITAEDSVGNRLWVRVPLKLR